MMSEDENKYRDRIKPFGKKSSFSYGRIYEKPKKDLSYEEFLDGYIMILKGIKYAISLYKGAKND